MSQPRTHNEYLVHACLQTGIDRPAGVAEPLPRHTFSWFAHNESEFGLKQCIKDWGETLSEILTKKRTIDENAQLTDDDRRYVMPKVTEKDEDFAFTDFITDECIQIFHRYFHAENPAEGEPQREALDLEPLDLETWHIQYFGSGNFSDGNQEGILFTCDNASSVEHKSTILFAYDQFHENHVPKGFMTITYTGPRTWRVYEFTIEKYKWSRREDF